MSRRLPILGLATFAFLSTAALSRPALAQASGSGSAAATTDTSTTEPKADESAKKDAAAAPSTDPPREDWDIKDVSENPNKTYLFIGARYRGNVVPKFVMNMFVDEGKTVYSNTVGLELDIRKDGFSLIPAISYSELGTGDMLFKEKGTSGFVGNYNMVNSSLKLLYVTADLLWSTKISKNLDFEIGAGFGVGAVFGDLVTNWVREDANGSLQADNGKRYLPCATTDAQGTGCNKADHQNSNVDKVGNYVEPSWFGGGSRPVVFPWLAVPQIGLRFKPIKQFVGRLGLGWALTGFWFGLSGEYGLEKRPER